MSDAAAAFLLSSMTFAKSKQLLPLARIVSWAQTGIDPLVMVKKRREDEEKENDFRFFFIHLGFSTDQSDSRIDS